MRMLLVVATVLTAACAAAMLADTPEKPDPNVGQFTGTMKVNGVVANGQFQPNPKCGSCHAQATVRLEQSGYVMDLNVTNSGKKKPEIVQLTGKTEDGKLIFKNEKFDLSLVEGKLLGKRTGRMQGDISMVRVVTSQPASRPDVPATSPAAAE